MLSSVVLSFGYLFFSSRRRHTRCALVTGVQTCALPISRLISSHAAQTNKPDGTNRFSHSYYLSLRAAAIVAADGSRQVAGWLLLCQEDRKSVVKGKSVSVRVDLGGRRIIQNRNKIYTKQS